MYLFNVLVGPPKALDDDETEFLDKLEMVRCCLRSLCLFEIQLIDNLYMLCHCHDAMSTLFKLLMLSLCRHFFTFDGEHSTFCFKDSSNLRLDAYMSSGSLVNDYLKIQLLIST